VGGLVHNSYDELAEEGADAVKDIMKNVDDVVESGGFVRINKGGDPVIVKGKEKIRIDFNRSHGDKPHFHFERKTSSGKWRDAKGQHRYYFKKQGGD